MDKWTIAIAAGVAAVATDGGRKLLKVVIKSGVRLGLQAKESFDSLVEEAREYAGDLKAEIEDEKENANASKNNEGKSTKTA